jgi:hypothetical protein
MPQNHGKRPPLRGFPWKGKFTSKEDIERYFSNPDGIQCLLCGRVVETLNGHLQMVHGTSHQQYRERYGLPWRRGLVSARLSNRLSQQTTERIRNGSFTPKPDNKAAVAKIRAGGRRKDQPFVSVAKAEKAKEQSKRNSRYSSQDFENVLSAMLSRKATLTDVCKDKNLPSRPMVLHYAESNPIFRERLLDTYYALPYAVQARADMFSPQFFEDLKRLRGRGLSAKEIGEELQVSFKTVLKRLKQQPHRLPRNISSFERDGGGNQ